MTSGYPPYQSPNPPTKASLRAWLKHFNFAQRLKKEAIPPKIFGVPLRDSLRIANVPISTANVNGELFVWGYVPVVVAKCGLYLKERATEVEGTFRINGSNKRMRDLQALFECPPKFGKNVDWSNEPYTVHDVASVFRRYLTQMPESVIPTAFYHQFRDVLAKKPFSQEEAIASCKRLIRSMPRANQYLLLYVLDLLSVFARKSDLNFMTAANLAVIFRPAILSLPEHEMAPKEHELSQRVIEFLIEHQDWFMSDMPPPPRQDSILTNKTNTTQSPGPEDIYVMPSDTDEEHTENGWKLIEKEKSLGRRRTIADAPALSILEAHKLTTEPSTLSAIPSDPETQDDQVLGLGVAGVKRSATTPSRKGVELEPRVLGKKRFGLGQNGHVSPN